MSEWHEKHGAISIGCQSHGPGDPFGKLKQSLVQELQSAVPRVEIGPIIHLAIALRVGGHLRDYPAQRISRVRVMSKRGYVGCDIEIPRSEWIDKSPTFVKDRLATYVVGAVVSMLSAVRKKGYLGNDHDIEESVRDVCRLWKAA